jgi:hypothetical protein
MTTSPFSSDSISKPERVTCCVTACQVKTEAGQVTDTVHLINWREPEQNDFAHRRGGDAQGRARAPARISCSTSTASPSACWN